MPRAPPPPLSEPRMEVVLAAWNKVASGEDRVNLSQLLQAYDAARHPRVLDGNMSVGQAKEVVARHFEASVADGVVSWEDFLQYHVRMSNEIDRGRSVDRDGTFVNIVVNSWKLDKDPETAMQPTGVIPSTLDCPVGLKRTRNMDLVWLDGSREKTFLAYRGAVKTRFARRDLPAHIRGHFAFADEIPLDWTVKPSPSRSAVITPHSIVWVDEATGEARGLKELVYPNVDLGLVPEGLRAVLMNHHDAEAKYGKVHWLALEQAYNPAYQKSSEVYGVGAKESAHDVLDLKKKAWEGNNCGAAWHGHTGKFTDSFNGGPYSFSGLNTATRR
jgi:hypothetical protein